VIITELSTSLILTYSNRYYHIIVSLSIKHTDTDTSGTLREAARILFDHPRSPWPRYEGLLMFSVSTNTI
jgi:hypothetical protein